MPQSIHDKYGIWVFITGFMNRNPGQGDLMLSDVLKKGGVNVLSEFNESFQ